MRYLFTILLSFLSLAAFATEPTRQSYVINDGWQFFYGDAHDSDTAEHICLPHTWNTHTEYDYKRTTANYTRRVWVPAEWQGKRLFLRFGGVQNHANVFVNGRHIGEHKGGFTAFTLEVTNMVKYGEQNLLRVMVSNNESFDILPTSTDITLYGGIYRDVELIVTPKSIISPLHYSSDGVIVEQHRVDEQRAEGNIRLWLSTTEEHPTVNVRIIAPDGYEVKRYSIKATKLTAERSVNIKYEIDFPELWRPSRPSLYTIEASIGNIESPSDIVVFKTGFRAVSVTENNKLCIGGEVVDIRGVNLAHDHKIYGAAISKENIHEDFATINDMGANAIRSFVGPHLRELYDLCDKSGVVAWVDMPFTRSPISFSDICYYPTKGFSENGIEQLREIIMQNYNHPSIVMWGIFSEVWQRGDNAIPYIKQLNDLAHSLDNSRLTVGCSSSDGEINFITDLIVFQQNVGWTKGSPEDVGIWCRQLKSNAQWSKLRYGVCYGVEGVTTHYAEKIERAERGTRHLPERRQTYMHDRYISHIEGADIFWGVWLNSMFDYSSTRRPYGKNQSGVVGFDHQTKKDAYYLYRALWNGKSPTLHIGESRWQERHDSIQQINIYSSTGCPTVTLNGEPLELLDAGRNRWRADSVVVRGRAEIKATDITGTLHDEATFTVYSE